MGSMKSRLRRLQRLASLGGSRELARVFLSNTAVIKGEGNKRGSNATSFSEGTYFSAPGLQGGGAFEDLEDLSEGGSG